MKYIFPLLSLLAICNTGYTQKDGIYHGLTEAIKEPEKVITLDLAGSNLTELPVEIKEFKNMEGLFLQNNDIRVLPGWLSQNTGIKRIVIDNNKKIDLSKSLRNVKTLELAYLSAENCNLLAIPLELSYQPFLQTINFSKNYVREIPYHLGKVTNLKNLNVSTNQISNISFGFWNCTELKSIDLSNNICFKNDTSILVLGTFTNLEYVKLSDLKKLNLIDAINTKQLELENCIIAQSFPIDNLNIEKLILKKCEIALNSAFFKSIAKNSNVKSLSLTECRIKDNQSNISLCDQLNEIEIKNTDFADYKSIQNLKQLQTLKLFEQKISEQELADLKDRLSETRIYSDNKKEYPFEKGPLDNITVPVYNTVINTNIKTTFETANVKITFPENSFVDDKGKSIKGNVQLNYREFFDPLSIAMSGINMRVDSNTNGSFMASAGMFELKSSQDGKEVFFDPKAEIIAEVTPVQTGNDFKQFSAIKGNNWNVENSRVNFVRNPEAFNLSKPTKPPQLYFEKVYFILEGSTADFTFNFKPYDEDKYGYNRHNRKRNTFVDYPEADITKKYKMQYKGNKPKYHFKQLDSINREVKGLAKWNKNNINLPSYIEDLSFVPDFNEDVLIMKFKYHGRNFEIPFVISEENLTNSKVQEKTKRFYTSMNRLKDPQLKRNKAIAEYDRKFEEYTRELSKVKRLQDSLYRVQNITQYETDSTVAALGLKQTSLQYYRTVMRLPMNGLHNLDRVISIPNNNIEPLMVQYELENSSEKPKKILLVDNDNNTCLAYESYQTINYDRKNRYSLIAIYSDQSIGVCSEKEFKEAKKTGKLLLRAISTKNKNLNDLRAEI